MKTCSLILLLLLAGLTSAATPQDEIEALLAYVKTLEGATFTRNGSDHTAIEAEAHLRLKYNKQKRKVKTAEQFIERCATKSSWTGEVYTIALKDGTQTPSATLLLAKLAELRKSEQPGPAE